MANDTRRFTAADGVEWAVEVRTVLDVTPAFGNSDVSNLGRRTFLYFTSPLGMRRVAVFPLNWRDLSIEEFRVLLGAAHPSAR